MGALELPAWRAATSAEPWRYGIYGHRMNYRDDGGPADAVGTSSPERSSMAHQGRHHRDQAHGNERVYESWEGVGEQYRDERGRRLPCAEHDFDARGCLRREE